MKKILFISTWAQGMALSGGDRIWIEFAKRWNNKLQLDIFCSEEAKEMAEKLSASSLNYIRIIPKLTRNNLFWNLLMRTLKAKHNLPDIRHYDIIYSTSDFWPDSIPAFYAKCKKSQIIWIAGFYLFAPKPWQKDSPYKIDFSRWLIGLMFWLTQLPMYWIIKRFADYIFVTSEPDVEKFLTKKRTRDKIIIVQGGVDTEGASNYLSSSQVIPVEQRKYDACFVGRFHYQKGVLALINIWCEMVNQKENAKLVMVGMGPLEKEVKYKIRQFNLQNNIDVVGFKDGEEKYAIYKQSKVVVHPATYDSGGMAACEAMAWGLPGVSFDLEALKTYYPKGMIKTPLGDLKGFAKNIIFLLTDDKLYKTLSNEAIELAKEWDWQKRAGDVLSKIANILN